MLRFVLILGVLMGLFNGLFYVWVVRTAFFDSYLGLNAELCAGMLKWFGESVKTTGTLIASPRYSLEIKPGCDAIQASAFFVFAMLAFPSSVSRLARVPYLLVGTTVLLVLNLVRILSLYYTGVYFPKAFGVIHIDVWQTLFIFLALTLWLVWARGAVPTTEARPDVVT